MATPEDVQVSSPGSSVGVVSFTGEHDLVAAAAVSFLLESLIDGNDLVVADFSGAQFIDSSMLHVVLNAHRHARELGKDFRIQLGDESTVRRMFQISGVLEQITWAGTREEALNGSQPAGLSRVLEGSDGTGA